MRIFGIMANSSLYFRHWTKMIRLKFPRLARIRQNCILYTSLCASLKGKIHGYKLGLII